MYNAVVQPFLPYHRKVYDCVIIFLPLPLKVLYGIPLDDRSYEENLSNLFLALYCIIMLISWRSMWILHYLSIMHSTYVTQTLYLLTPVLESSTVLIVPVKISIPVSSCKQAVYLLLSISLFSWHIKFNELKDQVLTRSFMTGVELNTSVELYLCSV